VSTASLCENVILLIPEIIPNRYIHNFRTVCKDTYECQKVNGEDEDDDETTTKGHLPRENIINEMARSPAGKLADVL